MGLLNTASLEPDKHDLHASGSTGVGKLRSWLLREPLAWWAPSLPGAPRCLADISSAIFKRP